MNTAQQTIELFSTFATIEAVKQAAGCGWRYDGVTQDGKRTTIRKKATRLYLNAFAYARPPGSSGNDKHALHNHFTFGRVPFRYMEPIKTWKVKET